MWSILRHIHIPESSLKDSEIVAGGQNSSIAIRLRITFHMGYFLII